MSTVARLLLCLILVGIVAAATFAADATDQARLEALRQALPQLPTPQITPTAAAQVCWAPDTNFSEVGVVTQVAYGPRILIARYVHPPVQQDVPLLAVWTHNGAPLSTGNCVMQSAVGFVTNGVQRSEAPLLPGLYCVSFRQGNTDLASGQITIVEPAPLGARSFNDVLAEGVRLTQEGLKAVNDTQAQAAAKAASAALPLLATALWSQPANKDLAGMFELAKSLVAIGKMDAAASSQQRPQTLDWANRALAHARNAKSLATDTGLQQVADTMVRTIEPALPKLREAAANN